MDPGNLPIHSLNGNGIFPDFSFVHLGNLVSHLHFLIPRKFWEISILEGGGGGG